MRISKHPILFIVFFFLGAMLLFGASENNGNNGNNGEEPTGINRIGLNILNSVVRKNIPRKFIFDDLNFEFLTGIGVEIIDLRMTENPDFKDHPMKSSRFFYRSERTHVKVKFLPLLIGKVHMHRMDITHPKIQLLRDQEGEFSIQDLFVEQREGPLLDWLNVDDMAITSGQLYYADMFLSRSPLTLSFQELDAMISGFSLNRDFQVDISMKGPGAAEKNIYFTGKAGPIKDSENFQEVPMDMDFHMEKAPLVPFTPMIPKGMPIPVSGEVFVNYHMKGDVWSGLDMKGDLSARNLILSTEDGSVKSIPFLFRVTSGEKMRYSSRDSIFAIEKGLIQLNKTDLYMSGSYSNFKENPKLYADFTSPAIDLEDIKKIHPFQEKYMPEGMTYSGFCKAKMHVEGTRGNVQLSAELDLTDTKYDAPGFFAKAPSTPQKFRFEAVINPETISIQSKGMIDSGEIHFFAPEVIQTIKDEFLAALKKKVRDVSILNLNKTEPLLISGLKGHINYNDAVMTVVDLRLSNCHQKDTEGIDATVNGQVDINKEILDILGEIRLSSNDSKKLIKENVFYTKMETDENGRLQIPIKITGTLKHPVIRFHDDVSQFQEAL